MQRETPTLHSRKTTLVSPFGQTNLITYLHLGQLIARHYYVRRTLLSDLCWLNLVAHIRIFQCMTISSLNIDKNPLLLLRNHHTTRNYSLTSVKSVVFCTFTYRCHFLQWSCKISKLFCNSSKVITRNNNAIISIQKQTQFKVVNANILYTSIH